MRVLIKLQALNHQFLKSPERRSKVTHHTSDFDVKIKYIKLSNAIHLAGSGRGLDPWCLYISE